MSNLVILFFGAVASLMEFKGRLISKIELFYDASPFQEKKNEVFEGGGKD
jgi:hypothetical protein